MQTPQREFAVQNYNKKMTYANKWGFFLDFPEDPERCANLEGDKTRINGRRNRNKIPIQ